MQAIWASYADGNKDAGYIIIMIYTGMMPIELLSLKKSNIDYDNQQICGIGHKTKVRKETPISIADEIIPVLKDLSQVTKTDKFLPFGNPKTLRCRFYKAL